MSEPEGTGSPLPQHDLPQGADASDRRPPHREPIAVIGLACRLPGADTPAALWDLLTEGRSALTDVPADRWDADAYREAAVAPDGRPVPARGGFVAHVADFDPAFFGISPREAAAMDPQQRLALELGWEAVENAHLDPDVLRGERGGVFVGATVEDYAALVHRHGEAAIGHHTMPGLNRGLIANRVSYALGLRGPSMTVDTAQSSSLVAVQNACDSLRAGDCDLALAGGVHLNLVPESTIAAARFGALSPDGLCYTFDERANGFVRGEGGGILVLKPLSRALADGDRVHGVIRGGAVNNDGTGDTVVSPDAGAQEDVLRRACARAGVDPAHVDYVELHGPGTPAGDPVEAAALGAALGTAEGRRAPLRVGSVKTNIGHLEGASGIAGLLKALLCVKHGTLVPSLNYSRPHPRIALDELNLRVQQDAAPWERDGVRPRTAGVSSFGMGGTNAHLIIEEPPEVEAEPVAVEDGAGVVPWVLSARSAEALRAQAERLAAFVEAGRPDVSGVGHALLNGRAVFEHRAVVAGAERDVLVARLAEVAAAPSRAVPEDGSGRGPVFVFPGQGAQWVGMGRELLDSSPVFAARFAECDAALAPFVDWSLSGVLRGVEGAPGFDRVDVVQPVLWAVMVSLAEVWRSYGVQPAAVVGHSQGEIAAACVSGALSIEDAARVVALRSQTITALAGRGGMVSVAKPRAEVDELISGWDGRISVAAVNGPSAVVVSGDADALDELRAHCDEREIRARRIEVDYASHSAHVESIRDDILTALAPVQPRVPSVPFFSTVTGDWLDADTLVDADYWYTNLRQTVQLEPAIRSLIEDGHRAFAEMSPHPVLTVPVQDTAEATDTEVTVTGTLRRDEGGLDRLYLSLGHLWAHGVEVDWSPAFPADRRPATPVDLPTYPFQRRRCWIDAVGIPAPRPELPAAAPVSAPVPVPAGQAALDAVLDGAAAVLGHDSAETVESGRTFKDLGFTSVTAVELRDRLNVQFGVRLPSSALFDHPTPVRLARQIDTELTGGQPDPAGDAVLPRTPREADEPIAIVAMGCRFPGDVRTPEDLWRVVRDGLDVVSDFPTNRDWDLAALHDPDPERSGTSYVSKGGFLHDAGEFDAAFFGISPREALAMDPQQRLLLETSWEALERAGIDPTSVRGSRTGVFVGAMAQDYGPRLHQGGEDVEGHVLTGTTTSVASGRIAYTLGLEGPAVTVDTACSSSLVALHMAAQSLRNDECSMALAGGATVMSSPGIFVEFSRQRGLSPDGRCKPFAAGADGTGWGEGVGVLLLERLSDARRNGHQVLAVLKGSAINQDGASNGLTAPNGPSQQRVIRAALANARLEPGDVDVVEAHGTGTTLGDPIEAQALLATYGRDRDAERPLWLGSLKSNVGHAQAAAGVGGVIKMVEALRHGVLPRSLHAEDPSPQVDWESGAVRLLAEAREWDTAGDTAARTRRAAVSSFGISGTNAHVILEAAAEAAPTASVASEGDGSEAVAPWLLSARTADALKAQAETLLAHLDTATTAPRPVDVGHTLRTARAALDHRAVVTGADRDELLAGLREVAAGHVDAVAGEHRRGPVFVFPGQGAQWVGMGRELLDSSPVFKARFAECDAALAPFVDWSLSGVLRGVEGAPGFDRVDVVQPVLWAVMVSLAEVWRSYGVQPAAVVGHSQGEIAAACVSGALSIEDAARVVALRSRTITALAGRGGMVSVALPRADAEELIAAWPGSLSVAAVNGPSAVVVSGDVAALDALVEACEEREVRARRIEVDYASHSAHVEEIREEILTALAPVRPRKPSVPFFSTVTGDWLDADTLVDADYWYTNLRQTVQLEPAVRSLIEDGHRAFAEMSPHPVLTMPVQDTAEATDTDVTVTGTLRRDQGGLPRLHASLGELWAHGVEVDWAPAFAGHRPALVDLPTYAFQRRHFWLATDSADRTAADPADARFWDTVEREDLKALAGTLGLSDPGALAAVLPALSSWRRDRRQRDTADSWRHRAVWRRRPEPAAGTATGAWLLVVPEGHEDSTPVAQATEALRAAGAEAYTVLVGQAEAADRELLAKRLRTAEHGTDTVSGVLSFAALDESPLPDRPAVPTGLAVTLALVQALGEVTFDAPLWCLTRGAVAADGEAAPYAPAQAAVWGLGRVAALEHPDRWGGLVDLPPPTATGPGSTATDEHADAGGVDARERTRTRLAALLTADDAEDQLALRDSGVYARRLVAAPAATQAAPRTWRPRGTALVTGGTGALGARVARWLARGGAEHVVLASRRGDADADGVPELRAELAEQGVGVTVAACDTSDGDAVRALAARLAADGHTVRAVVHAAGVSQLGTLEEADTADLEAALGGKVRGAEHLAEAFGSDALDAVVHFSSISGTWGVADHGAYAAANAALDAYAARQRADGLPALSVAWGPWAGGGMIADSLQDVLRQRGVPVIDPDTALHGLQRALDLDDTVVAVADVDWPRFGGVFTSVRPSRLLDEIPAAQPAADDDAARTAEPSAFLRELAGLDERRRNARLVALVREQVASVLGHADPASVDPQGAFKELGFDSLTAVELRNRLHTASGLKLGATVVFDYPTVRALAGHLSGKLTGSDGPSAASLSTGAVRAAGARDGEADEPIAIVAMSCRFPGGVRSPEDLWRVVRDGVDVISDFPTDRGWDLDGLYDPDPDSTGKSYVRRSGFLHDAADFDAAFFGISPREAVAMDPQQRLLLETSWEALERAGLDPAALRGSPTGVYVGMTDQEYGTRLRAAAGEAEGYLATGAVGSVASGRISYTLGLEGPAVTVDTACSSSLVALHMAAQALRNGECTLALAGAVMVMSDPSQFIAFSRQRGLAPDGRSKPFAAAADGFALSEGAGVIVLERLSDARVNGHQVLGVVRGSAINQDGASNGLTAPNGPSQQRVIRAALAQAGLSAGDVDAVEAHGTGTKLGDPIEAEALLATYGEEREAGREPLWLGSVKSNIGHAQTASGMAGVMKMVLAMRHDLLPATLHIDEPSPHVDWSSGTVELLAEARPWERNGQPRRAGVSSFGVSGTNAHLIIEEPPEAAPEVPEAVDAVPGVVPWVVSGRSGEALRAQAERLADFAAGAGAGVADVGHSLVVARAGLEHRAVVTGSDVDGLVERLRAVARGELPAGAVQGVDETSGESPDVVFVFPGQGAQWVGMGRELLDSSPVFKARFAECDAALAPFVDWSLSGVLRGVEGAPGFDRVDVVQPVLWAVMVSLAEVWRSYGVQPAAVVGHSQGEIAAACVSGALSIEDAARVVALRSQTITALAGRGGMVSVAKPRAEVDELIAGWEGRISVAAVNGPSAVVVSGDADALDELRAHCDEREIRARRIEVDYASHSAHVESIREAILTALAPVQPRVPSVPFFSTVTGDWLDADTLVDADYWYTNLRQTVQLEPAIRLLIEDGHRAFAEMSPHPVLTVPVQDTAEATDTEVTVTGTLRRDEGGLDRLYLSLGHLWAHGVEVDWSPAFAACRPNVVDLPTYAFQRQRFWLEVPDAKVAADPVDAQFWETVEREDLEALAGTLGITDSGALGQVLPALSSWRRDRQQRATVDSWRYRIVWRPRQLPKSGVLDGDWLLAVPASHRADPLVGQVTEAVMAAGARVNVFTVDPSAVDDGTLAEQLLTEAEFGADPRGVLSLLALDDADSAHGHGVSRGLLATIALAQTLEEGVVPAAPLWCLTRGAVSTGPDDASPAPAQAAVRGLVRVFGLDEPERFGGLVDLPAHDGPDGGYGADDRTAALDLLAPLLAHAQAYAGAAGADESSVEPPEEDVALRPSGVHARRMVRAPLSASPSVRQWCPHGTVLVTGGTGALGSHVARDLAREGAEHLLLVSRRGENAPGAAELREELTTLGARVTVAACDVADRTALAELLAAIPADLPLTAVMHTAGVVGDPRPLAGTSLADAAATVRGKVAGALHLDELLADAELEAFVLFSSGAGVWGNGGQGPYAAANAQLDALAERRRATGRTATSVAWGAWADGGMVDEAVAEQLRRRGVPEMAPDLAVRALGEAVDRDETALVVADIRWDRFLPAYASRGHRPLLDDLPDVRELLAARRREQDAADAGQAEDPGAELVRRLKALPEPKRKRALVDLVRGEAGAVLGHASPDQVKADRAFRELGFDSLTAVELRNRLAAATGLKLPAALVFDQPTPNALAAHLRAQLLPEGGDGAEGGPELPAELQQLDTAYREAPDDDARRAMADGMRALLSAWDGGTPREEDDDGIDEEVAAASDQDMFDLIDRELGIS
ncbi:type I polyketide synthase [Streptomyces sp. Z26]|uniref:type I polyketide synthase n=1 Tax=Streptomyces sp. Z26 TaxID=2500177 RepID=UPI000EF15F17|nr:type I polyketide synthase [Streptomyces sp. Z26]RLL70608.1 SDR family NAD(P)-dependent oxidoreductase [Streptomyces sp. Z26]